jgi:hypothetical protein
MFSKGDDADVKLSPSPRDRAPARRMGWFELGGAFSAHTDASADAAALVIEEPPPARGLVPRWHVRTP